MTDTDSVDAFLEQMSTWLIEKNTCFFCIGEKEKI